MKTKKCVVRLLFIQILLFAAIGRVFSQTYISVPIQDEVYLILNNAQMRGLCPSLPAYRPYTEKQVETAIDTLLSLDDGKVSPKEKAVLEAEKKRLFYRKTGFDFHRAAYYIHTSPDKVDISADIGGRFGAFFSDGLYNTGNSFGMDLVPAVYIRGNLGSHVSYNADVFGDVSMAPLTYLGSTVVTSLRGGTSTATVGTDIWAHEAETNPRPATVNVFDNRAFLPFSYTKIWDGSIYMLSNMTASGLSGWPDGVGFGFGMNAEINASFLNDRIFFRFGRVYREWGGMDDSASLILNSRARPFLSLDGIITIFPWLRFSFITGVLEMPNAIYISGENPYVEAARYQNVFSSDMIELDFKYFDMSLGTSAIWPKRFELGYLFPLFNKVFYQNNIGDYDNINLFLNMRGKWPGVGSVWFSFYLDEINGFSKEGGIRSGLEAFTWDRAMFAFQVGAKAVVPWIPFTNVSLRYTKIEPYCYTHQMLKNTPWFPSTYISESYTNNGTSLGYYLPPNSDELRISFDTRPTPYVNANVTYQFIRHGADYGSRQVDGSSLYSELSPDHRGNMRSYFLQDGAYQWFTMLSGAVSWRLMQFNVPVTLNAGAGLVYSWFTDSDGNLGEKGSYSVINTEEYPQRFGMVLSAGVKIFY